MAIPHSNDSTTTSVSAGFTAAAPPRVPPDDNVNVEGHLPLPKGPREDEKLNEGRMRAYRDTMTL